MNSYLSLVSEYSKVHKKKNKLTIICIAISVMLITTIFGMADMSLRSQTQEAIRRYGYWHAIFSGLSDNSAAEISEREDVNVSSWLGMADNVIFQDKELIIQSSSEEFARQMNLSINEGRYPAAENEALLDRNGLLEFGLSIGDSIEVIFPDGQVNQYIVTGTFGDYSSLKGSDAHGLQLSVDSMRELPTNLYREYYYVQFRSGTNINNAIEDIKSLYGISDEQVSTNLILLGLMGESNDTTMLEIYLTAGILFVLVAMAAVFMIASSFNMSILERTQFFGLLRCLGATKRQVRRYIRREGLLYCIKAVPLGLLAGSILQWLAMFVLNKLNSQYLPVMPSYQISWLGLVSGAIIGIFVVMIASSSPAKRAAKVSPQAAITGNIAQVHNRHIKKASNTSWFRVDTAMGLRNAFSNKKSMIMIAGSFATSIILFLCFSVFLNFMNHALNPLKPYTPDLSIESAVEDVLLKPDLLEELRALSGADIVYGRMYLADIPASTGQLSNTATLVSYDISQFQWAKEALIEGSMENAQNGDGVLIYHGYSSENHWQLDDTITLAIDGTIREIEVAGVVSDVSIDAANNEWIIIVSESTFTELTGITDYKVVDMQVSNDISIEVKNLLTSEMRLLDLQQHNNEVRTGYHAMAVFVYGFLIIIAFVALINIINTVGASVSNRMNNYGVMRAVGMSGRQLKKIIVAESSAYAIIGCFAGSVFGVGFHYIFYNLLITSNWGQLWKPPLIVLTITIFCTLLTTFLSVYFPAKKIENMSIVSVVNAQ